MQKVKITKVFRKEVDTSIGKANKIAILTETHGEKWLSCFENKNNSRGLAELAEGQEVTIIVTQKGDFLNFRLPTGFDYLREDVDKLNAAVFGTGKGAEPVDEPPVDPSDVPF